VGNSVAKKSKENKDIIEDALKKWQTCQDFYAQEYKAGEEDLDFVLGKQWSADLLKRREGRLSLTENRLLPFVHQVVNSVRQLNLSINVSPVDDKADVETAEILQGMIRNIEYRSNSASIYDTAVWNAVTFGRGWLRINTKYIQGSFDQEICLERVLNPASIYLDPNHTKQDGSDAEYAFIFDRMSLDAFKELYPNASTEPFVSGEGNFCFLDESTIVVTEYFKKTYKPIMLYKLTDGSVTEEKPLDELLILDTREEQRCTLKWYKLTARDILEETEWASEYIPIIPVYGVETWQDGKRKVYSFIHQAKDPQMMLNMWKSTSVEVVALQPKAPFIGAIGQFESDAESWANANTDNLAYLQYDPIFVDGQVMPPPQRQMPPSPNPAILQEAMAAADAIKATLGMFDASMGMAGNEISGLAIQERKLQGDNATFHIPDNLGVALSHYGRCLVDLIPKISTGRQIARIIGIDEQPKLIPINQPFSKNERGDLVPAQYGSQVQGAYNLDVGRYDVVVDVGSSYATRRKQATDAMLDIAKIAPEIMQIAPDIFLKNLDIPDSKELVRRVKTIIDPALLEDDPMAAKLMAAKEMVDSLTQQLSDAQTALMIKSQNEGAKIEIDKGKLALEAKDMELKEIKTLAEVQKMQAETNNLTPDLANELAMAIAELDDKIRSLEPAYYGELQPSGGDTGMVVPAQEINPNLSRD
jgi:hypothetical protein